jgi:hypothetical protein
MTLRIAFSAAALLLILPTSGCNEDDCEGSGGISANYTDRFAGLQDVHLPQTIYEVEQMGTGEETFVEIEVANIGGDTLEVLSLELIDSDANWEFNSDDLPISIAEGASEILQVHYTAVGGPDTYAIAAITTNDPHLNDEVVHVGLHGVSSGELATVSASPSEVDFGFTFRGEEVRRTFSITNEGTAPLEILAVEFEGGAVSDTVFLSCPGATLLVCNWEQAILPVLLQAPVAPGASVEIEVAFTPRNQQAQSAQIVILTSDPQRPELPVLVRGNSSEYNCTDPEINELLTPGPLEYPSMATMDLEVSIIADDRDQPRNSIIIDMIVSGEQKEDAFTDLNGLAEFDLDLSNTDPLEGPVFTPGLHTIRLEAKDTCQLVDAVTMVAMLGGTLSNADNDGDGYDTAQGDCDDGDPTSYPGALEVFDSVDNDCDTFVDNDTEVWDDDCDGFCESDVQCLGQGPAEDGLLCAVPLADTPYDDCNDSARDNDEDGVFDGTSVNPEATESQNRRDDNCNSIVDEGTNFYDDDGDGFTESTGDCDDEDPTTFGGARDDDGNLIGGGFEFCDEADNDCDGETDENCVTDTAAPRIVGAVTLTQYELPLGEQVTAGVIVLSEDAAITYSWASDVGLFPNGTEGATVVWTAPEWNADNLALYPDGGFANLIVTVTDTQGRSAQGFTEVSLWVGGTSGISTTCGCSTIQSVEPLSGGVVLFVLLAAMGLRRRE